MSRQSLSSYSQEQMQKMHEDYVSGMSTKNFCTKYNLTLNQLTVIRRTKKWKRTNPNIHPMVKQAVQEHINGTLLKDVCSKYNISNSTVYKYMKKNNIEYKNGHGKRYHCDENFFHEINTEEKAYWLGFIFGDGSVGYSDKSCTAPNRLVLNLSSVDRCQLTQFNHDINSNFPIIDYIPKGTYAEKPMSRLNINSITMCKDLVSHGCIPNKTKNLSFPYTSLPEELYHHFIRGVFDADGYIGIGPVFKITKYIPFLEQIQNIMSRELSLNITKIGTYNNRAQEIGDLRYGEHKQVLKIAEYMYHDANVFLERKCLKAYSILVE